jgi:hypothetical protein
MPCAPTWRVSVGADAGRTPCAPTWRVSVGADGVRPRVSVRVRVCWWAHAAGRTLVGARRAPLPGACPWGRMASARACPSTCASAAGRTLVGARWWAHAVRPYLARIRGGGWRPPALLQQVLLDHGERAPVEECAFGHHHAAARAIARLQLLHDVLQEEQLDGVGRHRLGNSVPWMKVGFPMCRAGCVARAVRSVR